MLASRDQAVLLVLVILGGQAACDREALDWVCPASQPGDLVISEIRGPQSGPDTYRQWLELYNSSGSAIDLAGVAVRLRRLDGGSQARVLVRVPGIVVEPGGYVVIGQYFTGSEGAHVDYGFELDLSGDLYGNAAVEIHACDVTLDQVVYRGLPTVGTWSLDGARIPDATGNDDVDAWCVDDVEDPDDTTQLGIRGTPGAANLPCSP